jgi:hypothetical protein
MIDPPSIPTDAEGVPQQYYRYTRQLGRQNTPNLGVGINQLGGPNGTSLEVRRPLFGAAQTFVFPVKVTNDGGSAGSSITMCSFTYTVDDLLGNQLGSSQAPYFSPARILVCACTVAPSGSYGTAFYDFSGVTQMLCLGFVQEKEQQTNC